MTISDLHGFLAIVMNMGLIHLPELEDYWKTSWTCEIPFFGRVLPRNRFEEIFWMLHVSHSEPEQQVLKVDKVQAALRHLLTKFQSSYNPGRNIAIDETMVGFRGRFAAKQYMPKKPTKWGVKAFTMADSSNGYMLNILLYTGRETLREASSEFAHLPQPAQVVMQVANPYLDRGHHFFTDRYYTSIPLAKALSDHNTSFTGTSNKNRVDLPDDIRLLKRMKGGEMVSYRADELLAVAWQPEKRTKPVFMVSTESSAGWVTVQPHNTHNPLTQKPSAVHVYNHNMNGVDKADQHAVYYAFERKTRKWWRKVFFWMMETAVVNSYIIYKEIVANPRSHLAYRRTVLEILATRCITNAPPRPRSGRPSKRPRLEEAPERLNQHLHVMGKREQLRDCIVCSLQIVGARHRTGYYCKTCPDSPTLHPDTCFERYHTRFDYKL